MFLMDEPLGHLEAYLRVELRAEVRKLQERLFLGRQLGLTHPKVTVAGR